MRPIALVCLALLLAGCAKPGESVQPPLACLARFAGEPALNAVLIPALQDDPEALAQRIAAVANDTLAGGPSDVNGTLRFPTQRGHVDYAREGDAQSGKLSVEWVGTPDWGNRSGENLTADLLSALGFAGESRSAAIDGGRAFVQLVDGEAIVGSGGVLRAEGSIRVGPLYELRAPNPRIDADRANQTAREFGACELGGAVETERAGWLVRRDSLAHVYRVERREACGAVAIDAQTGAVHEFVRC